MKSLGKVGVLYGGSSAEREVSLMSGQGVHEALIALGVDAHLFDTGRQSLSDLIAQQFDRVFIALHGRYGEDGTIQGALELMRIPYTGSGHQASSVGMDKIMTKRLWMQTGLQTPEFRVIQDRDDLQGLTQQLGLPLIIKAPNEGSTLGLYRVNHEQELEAAYDEAIQFDSVLLAEQFIQGRELTVAVLGTGSDVQVLPIIEIVAPDSNYDYEHKYFSDETEYLCPAPLEAASAEAIQLLAKQAYLDVGCSGWGRVDIMLDSDNHPWLLEVNTSPGMTPHSLVPMAAKAIGISYAQLCLSLLQNASCKVGAGGSVAGISDN